jgi:hypothetical protein
MFLAGEMIKYSDKVDYVALTALGIDHLFQVGTRATMVLVIDPSVICKCRYTSNSTKTS